MAKEPYKDPFENLPRRVCGFVILEPHAGKKTTCEAQPHPDDSDMAAPEPTAPKIARAKAALATAKAKRGPKKGAGGRPPKDGPISKRAEQWRKKKGK